MLSQEERLAVMPKNNLLRVPDGRQVHDGVPTDEQFVMLVECADLRVSKSNRGMLPE
jgi:hypothetical protein